MRRFDSLANLCVDGSTLKTIRQCEIPLFSIQPRVVVLVLKTKSQLTTRHCARARRCGTEQGQGGCHGRKEGREMRTSWLQLPSGTGQQILWIVLRGVR